MTKIPADTVQAEAHARLDAFFAQNAEDEGYAQPTYVYNPHIQQRRFEK